MKKMTTVLAAMLLALSMMAMPAMAHDIKTLEQLEHELADAQADVVAAQTEVTRLEGELATAQQDVSDKNGEIENLQTALTDAEEALAAANAARDQAYAALTAFGRSYDATKNECNNRDGVKVACEQAIVAYSGTVMAVTDADAAVTTIEDNIESAKEELGELVAMAEGLSTDKAAADSELAEAIIARDATQVAVDTYAPPTAEVHPGCKGIANAQTKVSKGNAPAALAAVASKLGC